MDEKFRKFIDDARGVALSAEEKAAGRAMLESYMALTPVRAPAAAVRPSLATRLSGFGVRGLAGKAAGVFSLVLALMLSSAGVSYAAEGALPGDALYPVKVGVNEELRAALAPSAEAKAAWEAERAERRLAEAETLAKKGRLKAETRASLEAEFKRHAENAKSGIAEVGVTVDENAAANVAARLEGSLRAHKKIIATLAASGEGSAEVGELEASIDAETVEAEQERGKTEAKVSQSGTEEAQAAATGRRGAAGNKIAEVRAYLAAQHDALGAGATADAEARLADAQAAVTGGDAKAASGDFAGAFAAYGKAQRLAQEAKLLIRAGHDLQIRVKLDAGDDGDQDQEHPAAAPQGAQVQPGQKDGTGDQNAGDNGADGNGRGGRPDAGSRGRIEDRAHGDDGQDGIKIDASLRAGAGL